MYFSVGLLVSWSDTASRIKYLTKYRDIDEIASAEVHFATYEKIPPWRTLPDRSPGKLMAKGCNDIRIQGAPAGNVPPQLESNAVIFVVFGSRACHCRAICFLSLDMYPLIEIECRKLKGSWFDLLPNVFFGLGLALCKWL
jgi:hypothetical protein